MSNMITELIKDQVEYYSKKGYKFYIKTSTYYTGYTGSPNYVSVVQAPGEKFESEPKVSYQETTNPYEIIKYVSYLSSFHPKDKNRWDFFLHIYEKYPKKLKQLMNVYDWLAGSYIRESYEKLFDAIAPTYEDIFKIIKCWTVKDWSITTVPLENIDKALKKRDCPENVLDEFWIKFLKDRKGQLKDVKDGPLVRNFLLKKYDHNEEKLQPFFEFFPILATVFQELPADVFEELPPITTSVIINTKKMRQTFLVDGFKEENYKYNTEKFGEAFNKYFELDHFEFVWYDTSKRMYQLNFHHHNPQINDDTVKQYIVDFYRELKRDPTMSVEEDFLVAWIRQNELRRALPEASSVKRKTVKI